MTNSFPSLATKEGPSTAYEWFVATNVEVTRECVLKMDRIKVWPRSQHPEVVHTRGKVDKATRCFDSEWTTERREVLNEAKQLHFSPYDRIKGKKLKEKVHRVEEVQGEQLYGESWSIINQMSEHKRSKEGQVAGCSLEGRVSSWFIHLYPAVDGVEEDPVLTNIEIDNAPFILKDLATLKSSLKCWAGRHYPRDF